MPTLGHLSSRLTEVRSDVSSHLSNPSLLLSLHLTLLYPMSWVDDPLSLGLLGQAEPNNPTVDHPALLEPYNYIADSGGKEIRTKLIEAFNLWLDVPESDLSTIRRVVRMLHNASLM